MSTPAWNPHRRTGDSAAADRVAREAARRLASGLAADEDAAVAAARLALDLPRAHPSRLLVHRHLEAIEQQAMGAEAWRADRRRRFEAIEELMCLLEQSLDARTLLVGRAVRGHLTGTDPVRLRIYTDAAVHEIAAALEIGGVEEMAFPVEETTRGRLDSIRWADPDCGEVVMVRMRPEAWPDRGRNLFRDEPVPTLDAEGLRRRLAGDADAVADAGDGPDQSAAENAASSSANEG